MAKLTDPDSLTVVVNGTATTQEVEIQTGTKTIKLNPSSTNLDDNAPGATSGVTGKCLYSKMKEVWKTDTTLNKYRFPIQMIYEAQFIWINGWAPADEQTRDLIRDAGFQETDGRENACIISLGSMDDAANDLAYYAQAAGFSQSTSDFDKTGELNENIAIKGTGGTPDNTGYLKCFLREQQKTYASYNLLSEQGLAALTYQAYRLPLANGTDLDAIDNDTTIGTTDAGSVSGVKYSELTIDYLVGNGFTTAAATTYAADDVVQDGAGRWARCTTGGTMDASGAADYTANGGTAVWEAYPGERQIGTNYYAFNRILDVQDTTNSFSARLKEIHSWAQYQLRQTGDINDNVNLDGYGTVNGNLALDFTSIVGANLLTAGGVFIDNYDTNDKNNIEFYDITVDGGGLDSEGAPLVSTKRTFPFTAAGNINFSDNILQEDDSETVYTMYFAYHSQTVSTGIAVTSSSGSTATLDYTSDAGALDHLASGDYIYVSGFTEAVNNGLWLLTGNPTTNTIAVSKVNGATVTDEAAGDSVTVNENPFESPNATIVDNNSGSDITGQVTASSIAFDYDYDNNVQRGAGTNGSDAEVIVVAVSYDFAQYITVPHTITRSTGQTINVSPVDELNYENAA